MRIGSWARVLLAATPLLAGMAGLTGCGDFWEAPTSSSTDFTLSNSGNVSVTAGSSATETITVTPENSFTGTVTLSCSVSGPSAATDPTTCNFSSSSLTLSSTSSETSTLTATTESDTTAGAYDITVTGVSGSVAETTTFCVEVGAGSCTAAAATSGNFYILNGDSTSGSGSIAGFNIQSSALTAIAGSSYTVTGGSAMAIAPSGAFLYVASTSGGLTLYSINQSTGALTLVGNVFGDMEAEALQIVQTDASNAWLLDASASGLLNAYPITATGAQDTSRSTYSQQLAGGAGLVEQSGMAVSPNGTLIAVALGTSGTEIFPFTPASTSLPIGTPYSNLIAPYTNPGGAALSVAFDTQSPSRYLYIGETDAFPSSSADSGGLRAFTIGSGSLNPLTTIPIPSGGVSPLAILPISTGDDVYVANGESGNAGNVTGFAVSSGALTLGSTVAAGVQPLSMAEDSTGSYVFEVGSDGSPYFDAYTFDATTAGQLDSQVTSTTAATSIAIVAAP